MNRMTTDPRVVVVGVNAHTDTHDAAVLNECGGCSELGRSQRTRLDIRSCSGGAADSGS